MISTSFHGLKALQCIHRSCRPPAEEETSMFRGCPPLQRHKAPLGPRKVKQTGDVLQQWEEPRQPA